MNDTKMLKRVFLRKILYRIDFQLITEKLQEEIFEYAVTQFSQFFSNQGCEQENNLDIAANDFGNNVLSSLRINTRPQMVFVLSEPKTNENDGRILKIGKTFIYLELDLNIETMGIDYGKWLGDIISHMKGNPMLRPTRVGIRKYNLFYILDEKISDLNNIFRVDFVSKIDSSTFGLEQHKSTQNYSSEQFSLNFSRDYSTGILKNDRIDNQLAHLIEFDFDIYSMKPEVLQSFVENAQETIVEMNGKIYEFFKHVMSDDIIKSIEKGQNLEHYNIIPF